MGRMGEELTETEFYVHSASLGEGPGACMRQDSGDLLLWLAKCLHGRKS